MVIINHSGSGNSRMGMWKFHVDLFHEIISSCKQHAKRIRFYVGQRTWVQEILLPLVVKVIVQGRRLSLIPNKHGLLKSMFLELKNLAMHVGNFTNTRIHIKKENTVIYEKTSCFKTKLICLILPSLHLWLNARRSPSIN